MLKLNLDRADKEMILRIAQLAASLAFAIDCFALMKTKLVLSTV